jgi:hypothetical protein
MRHQKLHLVDQNSPVSQNKVFPQAGDVGRVQKWHVGLFRRAGRFAVVATFAGGDDIHPVVLALQSVGNDVLTGQFIFMKVAAAVGADVTVAYKQLAVGQAWTQIKRVDAGHTFGANDGADVNNALLTGDGVVATAKGRPKRSGSPLAPC